MCVWIYLNDYASLMYGDWPLLLRWNPLMSEVNYSCPSWRGRRMGSYWYWETSWICSLLDLWMSKTSVEKIRYRWSEKKKSSRTTMAPILLQLFCMNLCSLNKIATIYILKHWLKCVPSSWSIDSIQPMWKNILMLNSHYTILALISLLKTNLI